MIIKICQLICLLVVLHPIQDFFTHEDRNHAFTSQFLNVSPVQSTVHVTVWSNFIYAVKPVYG